MREEELLRQLRHSTSTEFIELLENLVRRDALESLGTEITSQIERPVLEELHYEAVLRSIRDKTIDEACLERVFNLFVLLMLNDGFELIEEEKS